MFQPEMKYFISRYSLVVTIIHMCLTAGQARGVASLSSSNKISNLFRAIIFGYLLQSHVIPKQYD